EVQPGEEQTFLDPLPIAKLWGVGPRARQKLEARGVQTVADMRALDPANLRQMFGRHGDQLARLARGIDARSVSPGRVAKSVSHEDTFAEDLHGRERLCQHLLHQATKVADRLARAGLFGRRVSIKIRDHNFRTHSRQQTLDQPTNQAQVIYQTAAALLDDLDLAGKGVRLTGVAVSQFGEATAKDAPTQLSLGMDASTNELDATPDAGQKVQDVLTEIRTKFGTQALFPAGTKGHRGRG
ncbi:MAG: DNA polymerase Y family protein, partial [Nannocystaceae bacterium]